MLGVDIVEESLIILGVTKILLLLIDLAFYHEGGLWKIFVDGASGKVRPGHDVKWSHLMAVMKM